MYNSSQTFSATDRLLFGRVWTVAGPGTAVEVLSNLNPMLKERDLPLLPEETIHNILHENWKKVVTIRHQV